MKDSKGQRVRELFNAEAKQLFSVSQNIDRLIPHSTNSGSAQCTIGNRIDVREH
jgi:hypothetical protein